MVGQSAGTTPVWKWRIALLLMGLAVLCAAAPAHAGDIIIVRSGDAAPYSQAADGFKSAVGGQNLSIRDVLLGDVTAKGIAATIGSSPIEVVAIGTPAAVYLHQNLPSGIPLVYCMVANPENAGLAQGRAAAGVSIDVPIETQLALIGQADPNARTVGMLYRSGAPGAAEMVEGVRKALPNGWKLEAVAVEDHGSVAEAIDALTKRNIDVIWTNLDSGIYETATVRTLLLAGLRTNLPVFGFSPAFVRAGALVGIGVDPAAQGRQAASLASKLLKNPDDRSVPRFQPPEQFQIAVNLIAAEKLGLQIPQELIGRATYVYGNQK